MKHGVTDITIWVTENFFAASFCSQNTVKHHYNTIVGVQSDLIHVITQQPYYLGSNPNINQFINHARII